MSQKSRKLSGFFGVEGQGPPAVSSLQKLNVKDGFFAGIIQSNSLSPLAEDRSHGFFFNQRIDSVRWLAAHEQRRFSPQRYWDFVPFLSF